MVQAQEAARVAAAVEGWKRKLLDLSKRNRARNFKVNKVSTVTVVDERPGQVFRQLYVLEGQMRFRATLPEPPDTSAGHIRGDQNAPGGLLDEGTFDLGEGDDEVELPAPEELDAKRHSDDVLQAHASPSALDRSLRRLDEQARTTVEEQGVNALYLALGMLHYRSPLEPDRELRAPIVLLPVALSRRSAGSGYTIRIAEDDPVVNPALVEYLRRSDDLALPSLPESAAMPENYDLQSLLDEVTDRVRDRQGWAVRPDIFLALFSFQKLVMYRDLVANEELFRNHRLLRQIVTRQGESVVGLPSDVERLNLDEEFAPEATAQVVDADSSQLRAIAAVARGHDLVLEGPPGTGKSQTITNLIGQALADGKRVLFVAEKMAALNVVHRRLVEAGLGEFCLELHSTKTNKREVLRSIRAALDASIQPPTYSAAAGERLPAIRASLNDYARAVHEPYGMLGLSPYAAYGELGAVLHAPKVRFARAVVGVTQAQVTDTAQALELLALAASEVGDPTVHPWRDTTRTFYSESDLDEADGTLTELAGVLSEVRGLAGEVEQGFGVGPIVTPGDVTAVLAVATVLERSPGAPAGVLTSEAWNAPPPRALELIGRVRRTSDLREELSARLRAEALEADHAADIAFVEERETGAFRWLNFLNGRYRLIRKRWIDHRQPGYTPSLAEQVGDMRKADELRRERAALSAAEGEARALFGALWEGEASDCAALEGYVEWVVRFRTVWVKHGLSEQAAAVASQPEPDVSTVRRLSEAADRVGRLLDRLSGAVGWPGGYLKGSPFTEIAERARAMAEGLDLAARWASYEVARARVATGPAAELLPQALAGEVAFGDLALAFRRAFYQKWVEGVVGERSLLREFHTLAHEQRVVEFQQLDRRVLLENQRRLVGQLRDQTQALVRRPEAAPGLIFLRGQINRQRGHAPLRRTLREAGTTVRAIKPCFLMSPLTVAQLLDGSAPPFDLVIFDEASQLTAEDAVGAVVRGRQLVVVGDPKQLPPTNFFAVVASQVTPEVDENGDPLVEDAESVLEECLSAGLPATRLKWHYRSRQESLIAFSNASFYDADLYTFPSVYTDAHARGLTFKYVADGVYEGKGLNVAEARRVADAVVEHARKTPKLSLGVGTFNLRQQIAIQDELELRRRQDPSLEPFFGTGKEEPFFVKNLENIQGDERDVIFLSVTYAKNRDGVLRHNFGPINGENGWRRLNVITTRARQHMRVFSSMRGDEIDLTKTGSVGARLLREFLLYAERGRLDSLLVSQSAQTESAFEADVLRDLSLRGLRLQPQVGVAGYRIDLGVMDDEVPGRFVCGIECDGAAYHSSATARDRDRLRQQVLEGRGWTLHRIWSTDWFKDRRGQVERVLSLVEGSRTEAREEARRTEAEREAARAAVLEADVESAPESTGDGAQASEGGVTPTHNGLPLEAAPYTAARLNVLRTELLALPFHEIPVEQLIPPIQAVVEAEAPLHIDDLATRVASAYGVGRVGSRIAQHVGRACARAAKRGLLRQRESFIWGPTDAVTVRSRSGTGIPGERIAPEEYQAAAVAVLKARGALERKALVTEIRSLFGFSRTGAQLEQAIQSSLVTLLAAGVIGEGGTGVVLRRSDP